MILNRAEVPNPVLANENRISPAVQSGPVRHAPQPEYLPVRDDESNDYMKGAPTAAGCPSACRTRCLLTSGSAQEASMRTKVDHFCHQEDCPICTDD